MKRRPNNLSLQPGRIFGSAFFALFLSIGMIATSCNSGNAQDHKEGTAMSKYQDIDVAKFDKMRKNKDYVVLDVRTPEEIAEGKIKKAVELDYNNDSFTDGLENLDKDKTYLVYCRSGGRSSNAAEQMIDMGFKSVYNLLGGYTDWSAAHDKDK